MLRRSRYCRSGNPARMAPAPAPCWPTAVVLAASRCPGRKPAPSRRSDPERSRNLCARTCFGIFAPFRKPCREGHDRDAEDYHGGIAVNIALVDEADDLAG